MNEKLLEIIEKQSEFNLVLLNHLDAEGLSQQQLLDTLTTMAHN